MKSNCACHSEDGRLNKNKQSHTSSQAHIRRRIRGKRDMHDEKGSGNGNGNESERWKMERGDSLLRQSERSGEKRTMGWNSTAFTCANRLFVCVCAEQQSKDPHNLKFKFQQFTWIYHEIQFMAMFLVFGVHITKSLVPNSFSLLTFLSLCVCMLFRIVDKRITSNISGISVCAFMYHRLCAVHLDG